MNLVKRMHALFIAGLVLSGLCLSANAKADYTITYQEMDAFQLVDFKGDLLAALTHPQIERVLAQIHGTKNLVLKVGLSHGGVVARFPWLLNKLKNKCSREKGSECMITTVFTAHCASACTRLPLLSNYSVSLPQARFGFHRTWFLSENLPIESKDGLAQSYIDDGGNAAWFQAHTEQLSKNQMNFYWMNKKDEIDSGLIRLQLKSWAEFISQYQDPIY